jgi:myo-inositol-1(or 4)-monophosphatase
VTVSEAELLGLAESIARETGALLLERFAQERRGVVSKTSPTDLVSQADLDAEGLIRDRLAAARPHDAILGEEGDDYVPDEPSGLRWVVDPLDGTTNFLFGIPQWAVSVAVEDEHGAIAGVVFDAPRGELWAATRGGAATVDGVPVSGSTREDLATALVATGFGYDAEVRETQAEVIGRVLPQVRDLRRAGAAALDLAWTAAGRYDAYFERGVQPWDVAAGRLLCERAGLSVRELPPAPPAGAGLLVAAPALLEPLAALL